MLVSPGTLVAGEMVGESTKTSSGAAIGGRDTGIVLLGNLLSAGITVGIFSMRGSALLIITFSGIITAMGGRDTAMGLGILVGLLTAGIGAGI